MKKGLAVTLLLGFLFAETLAFSLTLKVYFYPLKYTSEILNISQTVNIDPDIIASIINVESGYNKNAKSNAGAIGLMQIMPSTASYISNLKNIEYSSENDLYLPEKILK
ncbi:MAG: transglycosylase SLT domain-containing protein [Clostridia bacterium]|nr:transglycosylase SLT domain-containing protein [Clostridia bacterium]